MRRLLGLMAAVLLAGCQATANYDYDEKADFNGISGYAWVDESKSFEGKDSFYLNELLHNRVKNAVERELSAQGLHKVPANEADVLINYHASVDKKLENDVISTHYELHRFNRRFYGVHYYPGYYPQQREYKVGTLVVDVLDKDRHLIWRGSKESRIHQSKTPQQRTQAINETIDLILSNFPPKPEPASGS